METVINFLADPFAMLLYGWLSHHVKEISRMSKEERVIISPLRYWRDNPYQTILSIIGALAGFGALYGTSELTKMTAFGIGFMSDSVADVIGKRSIRKIEDV